MRPIWLKIFLVLAFFCINSGSFADVAIIPFDGGRIPTVAWMARNSKAVLIFLPGGNGQFNMTVKNPPNPVWILSKIAQTGVDIVYMDSDTSLGERDLSPRQTAEHVQKIVSVVQYFKKQTGKPIFLIGHSNGAISLAEFLNRSPANQKLIAGAIFSGSRNEAEITASLNLRVLIMHHEEDPNSFTTPASAERLFRNVKSSNKSNTSFALVHGGFNEGNPATSGRHMYAGSHDEAAHFVRVFIGGGAK